MPFEPCTMNADEIPMNVAGSHYGHSTGRWVGRTLHVHTDHMNWGWFDQLGIPLSDDAEVDEEFKLADDGGQLDLHNDCNRSVDLH